MKQIELNLQKRLLIVELSRRMEYLLHKDELHFLLDGIHLHEIKYGKFELICKGSELTEEIAKDLVNSPDNFQFLDAENTFIGDIEKGGYYWGENPVKHPEDFDDLPSSLSVYVDAENKHFEAELKTFNPAKTLIFEILL